MADDDNDEDEDEETLQLQLQALQAKLKLKRLQQKKGNATSPVSNKDKRNILESARKENVPPSSRTQIQAGAPKDVQIPVSPQRKATKPSEPRSPGRILLGIDKGLKGRNVSLRRPTRVDSHNEDPFLSSVPPSSISRRGLTKSATTSQLAGSGKSFSEKIAESRQHDRAQSEREAQRYLQRSAGFGVGQKELDAFKEDAERSGKVKHHDPRGSSAESSGFSREQVLNAMNKRDAGVVRRSKSSATVRQRDGDKLSDVWRNPNAEPEAPKFVPPPTKHPTSRARSHSPYSKQKDRVSEERPRSPSEDFDAYSTSHLSKRLLPHDMLTRTFSGKSVLRIPDLLGTVKSPDYSLPDNLEADYVVLGIIASKSAPLNHKDSSKTINTAETTSTTEAARSSENAKGKFMVLTLTDLKWTLDLYLFTTAYTRFYKLNPGTVVALLNPNIMPPPPQKSDTGRFSLTLNSSDDTVLEIGTSRDLGWCKAHRKDGKQCSDWIDKRHTEVCEFHVDRVVERARRGRMEVQGMSAPFAPGGRKQGRTGFFGGGGKGSGPRSRRYEGPLEKSSGGDGFRSEGQRYDRTTSTRFFVAPAIPGRSAAQLLDAEGMMTSRGESKEERVRKRLAEREKENEIARRLGEGGNGAGSEYLRLRQQPGTDGSQGPGEQPGLESQVESVDAVSLGLLGNKAGQVHLSPLKGLKRKGMAGDVSARKKTRFLTEAGIKEAGRESLPGAWSGDQKVYL